MQNHPACASGQRHANKNNKNAKEKFLKRISARAEARKKSDQTSHPCGGMKAIGRVAKDKIKEKGNYNMHIKDGQIIR